MLSKVKRGGGARTHLETTSIIKLMCTQQNMPNCCLRYPFFNDMTKPINPMVYSEKLMNRWFVANGVSWASAKTTCWWRREQ